MTEYLWLIVPVIWVLLMIGFCTWRGRVAIRRDLLIDITEKQQPPLHEIGDDVPSAMIVTIQRCSQPEAERRYSIGENGKVIWIGTQSEFATLVRNAVHDARMLDALDEGWPE